MIEPGQHDDEIFDEDWEWGPGEEALETAPAPPGWRRPALITVAVVTIVAMALIPLYNVMFARSTADNGLEICGFDYCVVQDHVREAGLDLTMSRLSHTFLDESEARELAVELADYLGTAPVGLDVVEDLEGRLGGLYDRDARSIVIESPARAWTVLHEVAHVVAPGHDEVFQGVVVELAAHLAATASNGGALPGD